MKKFFKKFKSGFTLVELVVVIAIIGILGAVSVAGYFGFVESAKNSVRDSEAAEVKTTLVSAASLPDSPYKLTAAGLDFTAKLATDNDANALAELKTYYTTLQHAELNATANDLHDDDGVLESIKFVASNGYDLSISFAGLVSAE